MSKIEELESAHTAAYDAYLDAAGTFDSARKAKDTAYAAYKVTRNAHTAAYASAYDANSDADTFDDARKARDIAYTAYKASAYKFDRNKKVIK